MLRWIYLLLICGFLQAGEFESLINELGSDDPKVRSKALKKAQDLKTEQQDKLILELKKSDDPELRFAATKIKKNEGLDNKGFIKTASGLKYKVLRKGKGDKPGPNSKVETHYVGKLKDGKVFDSSRDRGQPATFPVNAVIKGWTEGLQLMSPGTKYIFIIPPELGYGARGAGGSIPPNSELIFEIELITVLD